MVPRRDLIFLDMPVEDAAKYVISIGVIGPEMGPEISMLPGFRKNKSKMPDQLSAE